MKNTARYVWFPSRLPRKGQPNEISRKSCPSPLHSRTVNVLSNRITVSRVEIPAPSPLLSPSACGLFTSKAKLIYVIDKIPSPLPPRNFVDLKFKFFGWNLLRFGTLGKKCCSIIRSWRIKTGAMIRHEIVEALWKLLKFYSSQITTLLSCLLCRSNIFGITSIFLLVSCNYERVNIIGIQLALKGMEEEGGRIDSNLI